MSLISCPECGGKVSDKAAVCPHCGFPEPREPDLRKYEVAFDGRVPKKNEYQVSCELFRQLGIPIDDAQKLANVENAIVKTGIDFETADAMRTVLCSVGAPAVVREVGTGFDIASSTVRCPNCGSSDYEIYENGFSIGKAVLGTLVAGSVGALAGFSGSNSRYRLCSKCGSRF